MKFFKWYEDGYYKGFIMALPVTHATDTTYFVQFYKNKDTGNVEISGILKSRISDNAQPVDFTPDSKQQKQMIEILFKESK
jgi:hypothetical protein